MTSLYSLRTTPSGHRITKFDENLNVESSYDIHTIDGVLHCNCPQQAKPTCRHRKMFNEVLAHVDSNWLYNYDKHEWRQFVGPLNDESDEPTTEAYADALVSEALPPNEGGGVPSPLAPTSPPSTFRRRI